MQHRRKERLENLCPWISLINERLRFCRVLLLQFSAIYAFGTLLQRHVICVILPTFAFAHVHTNTITENCYAAQGALNLSQSQNAPLPVPYQLLFLLLYDFRQNKPRRDPNNLTLGYNQGERKFSETIFRRRNYSFTHIGRPGSGTPFFCFFCLF